MYHVVIVVKSVIKFLKEDYEKSTHFVQFFLFIAFNMRTNEALLTI